MERISAQQVRDFIDPRAFATPRTEAARNDVTTAREKRITTSTANESLSLLLGGQNRLEDLLSNMLNLRDLAAQGARGGLSDYRYDELFGKIRSLSAGIGQAVEGTQFDGKAIFDGRELKLSNGANTFTLETKDLNIAGEEALNLVKQQAGGKVTVGYEAATLIRNQNSGLTGLDIADAVGVERTDGKAELADGKYQLEIKYAGPDSTIIVRDQYGAKLSQDEGIDLSGSGTEIVQLSTGIQLTIEKEQLLTTYDKYPYETLGPVSLFADLDYEQVNFQALQDGEEFTPITAQAEFVYQPKRRYDQGSFNILKVETDGVSKIGKELEAGTYTVKVKYRGEDSIVELRDNFGRMLARQNGLDLTEDGEHTVDLGVGVRLTLENRGLDASASDDEQAVIRYTPGYSYERNFDFGAYIERIDAAIAVLDEQLTAFDDAITQIEQVQQWQRGAASNNNFSSVYSLLNGTTGGGLLSLLNPKQASAQLSITGTQLFSSINGLAVQGNLSPNVLSYLK